MKGFIKQYFISLLNHKINYDISKKSYVFMTDFEKRIKSRFPQVEIKTIIQFSKMVGVSDTAMRNIFKKEDCKISLLLRMCEVLNCTPNDLLLDSE